MKALQLFLSKNVTGIFLFSLLALGGYGQKNTSQSRFGSPNSNAPKAIKDYQELIGLCDCTSYSRLPDGAWADGVAMTWEFKYIMDGMAVQDETIKADGKHSGSIRQFNADSALWYVHYYASASNSPALPSWQGTPRDTNIVLYREQKAPNGTDGFYRLTFSEISDQGFNWQGAWVSVDESYVYPTWKIDCKKRNTQ